MLAALSLIGACELDDDSVGQFEPSVASPTVGAPEAGEAVEAAHGGGGGEPSGAQGLHGDAPVPTSAPPSAEERGVPPDVRAFLEEIAVGRSPCGPGNGLAVELVSSAGGAATFRVAGDADSSGYEVAQLKFAVAANRTSASHAVSVATAGLVVSQPVSVSLPILEGTAERRAYVYGKACPANAASSNDASCRPIFGNTFVQVGPQVLTLVENSDRHIRALGESFQAPEPAPGAELEMPRRGIVLGVSEEWIVGGTPEAEPPLDDELGGNADDKE